ncbi:hypothetical protein V502_04865 [Pseudogymnoascus sp. VKM F-4520 (FW-2644)]|nr:hypothetical protein V502_04865 [Pseudogymnoascus sp. VKM F-4520 (FW-2644)]
MDLRSIINNEGGGDASRQDKAQPATPAQTGPSPGLYREYSQHSQPAPRSRQASQDYGAQAQRFTSPTAYQGSFQGRPPPPPPLQPPSNDLRSPATSSHYSGQSPFRHTPSSSTSGGAFPFPQNPAPQSPGQAHQYPPAPRHRESYSQNEPPPQSQNMSYPQASPVPLTPPIGSSNVSYPFPPHQRPQSSHSSPTPSSAQSQQNLYTQHLQESPVANNAFPPTPFAQDQAQRSQPGTPFRQPMTVQRQSTGSYPFPTSPYQQRAPSLGVHQDNTKLEHISPSPSISAAPTTPAPHNQNAAPAPEAKRNSQSEREHSMSVSPKTTVFGQPKSEAANQARQRTPVADPAPSPAKRKIDDRRSSDGRAPSSAPNGDQSMSSKSQSPQEPRKRRRYNEPPIWAQSWMLYKKNKQLPASSGQVNGKPAAHAVPESPQPQPPKLEAGVSPAATKYDDILGPWEPSISDTTPVNDLTKAIADFLYLEVVNRNDWGELESRGVAVEIEAKLGQLIDKETNQRYYLPVLSECVLAPSNRISFRSSMTEEQHKRMNDFLNGLVTQTHPSNVNRPKPRVPIQYAHRRERDSFFELPKAIVQTLPPTIQHFLKQTSHHAPKVRVTHDQRTGAPLAQIIKTRVKDLDIYLPNSPLDCRISVNLEMRYDGDSEALARGSDKKNQPDRNKDRLSYTQSHYQIDLTQVTSASGEKEHELEIEIETKTLVEQGQRLQASQPHRYDALVEGLINNIHVLTKELSLPMN